MKFRAVFLALACPAMVAAQEASSAARPAALSALRLPTGTRAPSLDGRLDDPAWALARPIDDFRQREPMEGGTPTERTEVRVLYDATTLYVGVHAYDSAPDRIVARILERDKVMTPSMDNPGPNWGGDDAVAVLLDPFHDRRNAVILATNANGAEFDALLTDEGRETNVAWRGVWRVAATRTADGWSAEFAIPFRSLRYATDVSTWGINVSRIVRRKNEELLWRGWTRQGGGFAKVSLAGELTGLSALPAPGANIEVRPYVIVGSDRERDDRDVLVNTPRHGIGGEIKLQPRAGLVLDATVNTDFAQVEADNEQVNLTRFSLFFPEKREFFLENAGIFEFGSRGQYEPPPFLMFFSRRIGIADDGPVPVLGGGRLTGRVGGQTIGLLSIATDTAFDQARTMFNVARLKRDLGARGYIGTMITDRRSSGASNSAGGVDFSLWPTQALNLQGFVAGTATRGPGGDGLAGRLSLDYQTGRVGVSVNHLRVGRDLDAQMGFVMRTDIQQSGSVLRYTVRPGMLGIRFLNLQNFSNYVANGAGSMRDWRSSLYSEANFENGSYLALYHRYAGTFVDEEFKLADSVRVPVGNYNATVDGYFIGSDPSRALTFGSNAERQQIYGGTITRLNANAAARLGSHVALESSWGRNWVVLPNGRFTADLLSVRAGLALSTRLFANALVQYNALEHNTAGNFRLQYIFAPGSDVYLVYNEARGDDLSSSRLMSRGARVKVAYLRRF